MKERFISTDRVLDRVCVSKTQLYRMIHAGWFPPPVPLGPQKVAFVEREIDAWMAARLRARQTGEGREERRTRARRAARARGARAGGPATRSV